MQFLYKQKMFLDKICIKNSSTFLYYNLLSFEKLTYFVNNLLITFKTLLNILDKNVDKNYNFTLLY